MRPISPDEYARYCPNSTPHARKRIAEAYAQWARSAEPQQPEKALENPIRRKKASSHRDQGRYQITYRVYACQPADFDNIHTKYLTDALVRCGLLPADDWRVLEGRVVSDKAQSLADERTEIEIVRLR